MKDTRRVAVQVVDVNCVRSAVVPEPPFEPDAPARDHMRFAVGTSGREPTVQRHTQTVLDGRPFEDTGIGIGNSVAIRYNGAATTRLVHANTLHPNRCPILRLTRHLGSRSLEQANDLGPQFMAAWNPPPLASLALMQVVQLLTRHPNSRAASIVTHPVCESAIDRDD